MDKSEKTELTPEQKAQRWFAHMIDALVPLENVNSNGHYFIDKEQAKLWLDDETAPDNVIRVSGQRPDPERNSKLGSEGFIRVVGANMRCWHCGAFLEASYNEVTNTLDLQGVTYEYDPLPDIGMERPAYDDLEALARYNELEEKALRERMKNKRTIASPKCPYDPTSDTVVRVALPSGRVVADDDLREVFDLGDYNNYGDYNTPLGQANVVKAMADIGCAYFPCGNTCPSVYRLVDGTFMIGEFERDPETYEEIVPKGVTKLAGICTDLWAVSLADYEDFLAKGGVPIEENDNNGCRTVFNIEPGVYEFTYPGLRGSGKTGQHATFKRIGDCS